MQGDANWQPNLEMAVHLNTLYAVNYAKNLTNG
jgi:hypothetical protein